MGDFGSRHGQLAVGYRWVGSWGILEAPGDLAVGCMCGGWKRRRIMRRRRRRRRRI